MACYKMIGIRLQKNEYEALKKEAAGKNLTKYARAKLLKEPAFKQLRTDLSVLKEYANNIQYALNVINKENEELFTAILIRLMRVSKILEQTNPQLSQALNNAELVESGKKLVRNLHDKSVRDVLDSVLGKTEIDILGFDEAEKELRNLDS